MGGDHLTVAAGDYYNIIREVSNDVSSSISSYYDELITKLQLQAMTEYEYGVLNQHQRQNHQKPQEEQEIHSQTRKKRILLVDDEPDHCMVYRIVLEDTGYECVSYTDSVDALQEFRPNSYDLVILDIKMPKLDGFALCEKIRELDRDVQIIFITASEAYYENFRKHYYPKLSNDVNINCLQKPIGNKELIQLVSMTIATKDTNAALK
jgi:CheY-like chemotaxis protein